MSHRLCVLASPTRAKTLKTMKTLETMKTSETMKTLKTIVRRVAVLCALMLTGLGIFVQPSGAATPSRDAGGGVTEAPMSLQQLISATPRPHLLRVHPGQVVDLPDAPWVARQLAQPWLTPQERAYLDRVPTAVTDAAPTAASVLGANEPAGLAAATGTSGDPVMSGGCTWADEYGFTVMSFYAYLGFSDNLVSAITQVSVPSVVPNITAWGAGTVTYGGYSFTTSNPDVGVWSATANVTGYFTQTIGPFAVSHEADITWTFEADGGWGHNTLCA